MSYMSCHICGEPNGVVGTTVFQCRCSREKQGKGVSNVGIPVELANCETVLPDSGGGNLSGNSNHYFQQVRMDSVTHDVDIIGGWPCLHCGCHGDHEQLKDEIRLNFCMNTLTDYVNAQGEFSLKQALMDECERIFKERTQ